MSFNHQLSALVCDHVATSPPTLPLDAFDWFFSWRSRGCPQCVPGRMANGFRAERNARVQAARMGWRELRDGHVVLDFCHEHTREDTPMQVTELYRDGKALPYKGAR